MTELTRPDRAAVRRLVHDVVHEMLPDLPGGALPGDRHLKELGADSVDRVEIIVTLTDRLGLDLPLSTFSGTPTVDALVDQLWEAAS